jgi:hypothetical protein
VARIHGMWQLIAARTTPASTDLLAAWRAK